jgi:hypothetical protein
MMNWPGRVARHDLVYETPPLDPMQGMPLGNGDVGALCWCDGSQLIVALNKCDLWDDAGPEQFHNWNRDEEEHSTTQRHACRLILDFQQPVFDVFYLEQFEGRLAISNGVMTMKSRTPFGTVELTAFVDYNSGVFVCTVNNQLTERTPVRVTLERFGSRTFSHWYALVNRDPSLGLQGAEAAVDGKTACITQKLTDGTSFAAACKIAACDGQNVSAVWRHSRAVDLTVGNQPEGRFSLLAAVTSPEEKDPVAVAKGKLDRAEQAGAQLLEQTSQGWRDFWNQSLMESGDDYLDNLWHVTMYYANASQRGPFPGRFINGLWGWNRDVQNWNFYFHWNQQQIYWPLNAAGHPELCDAYLNYRFNSLPNAKKDAATTFHADGAIVSDVAERRGRNSASEFRNHTPVAQIAMDFWRQFQFTRDRTFLREKAVPYLVEASKFFESLFDKEADGKYHARGGTGYEGWIELHDPVTELASAKALLTATLAALKVAGVDEPRASKWQEILDNLAPLQLITVDEKIAAAENGTIRVKRGLFRGATIPTGLSRRCFPRMPRENTWPPSRLSRCWNGTIRRTPTSRKTSKSTMGSSLGWSGRRCFRRASWGWAIEALPCSMPPKPRLRPTRWRTWDGIRCRSCWQDWDSARSWQRCSRFGPTAGNGSSTGSATTDHVISCVPRSRCPSERRRCAMRRATRSSRSWHGRSAIWEWNRCRYWRVR